MIPKAYPRRIFTLAIDCSSNPSIVYDPSHRPGTKYSPLPDTVHFQTQSTSRHSPLPDTTCCLEHSDINSIVIQGKRVGRGAGNACAGFHIRRRHLEKGRKDGRQMKCLLRPIRFSRCPFLWFQHTTSPPGASPRLLLPNLVVRFRELSSPTYRVCPRFRAPGYSWGVLCRVVPVFSGVSHPGIKSLLKCRASQVYPKSARFMRRVIMTHPRHLANLDLNTFVKGVSLFPLRLRRPSPLLWKLRAK
jgi:hypothetical protein